MQILTEIPTTAQSVMHRPRASSDAAVRVTIGMPVFNGASFIQEALDSLLAQTFTDFELIISDNASTDGTQSICRKYAAQDGRIRYVRQVENRGATSNFKFLLDEAAGEYFMWAASDDVWSNDWLSTLTSRFEPDFIGLIGRVGKINANSKKTESIIIKSYPKDAYLKYYLSHETSQKCMFMYALFNRKKLQCLDLDILGKVPFWSDALFIYSALALGPLASADAGQIYYRGHESNSGKLAWRQFYDWRRIFYRAYPFSYHMWHVKIARGASKKLIITAVIPIKHAREQLAIWLRGLATIFIKGPKPVFQRFFGNER